MDALEDELDLRYHKGLDPDVYYRLPAIEVRSVLGIRILNKYAENGVV